MEILQKQDFAAASFANDDTNAQAGLVIQRITLMISGLH
jgi:hypothetical protein